MICPSAREAIKTPEWSCPDTQVLGPTPPSTQSLPMPHVPFTKSALAIALAYSVPGHQNLDFSCHTVAMSEHYTWPLLLEKWCCFFLFLKECKLPSLPVNPKPPQASRIACLLQESSPESTYIPSQMRSPGSGSHSFCTNLQHFPPHTALEPLTSPIPD